MRTRTGSTISHTPEFTETNLFEEAPADVTFDEDDPSADWLDQAAKQARVTATPIEMQPKRPPMETLSNSVQDNFREYLLHRI